MHQQRLPPPPPHHLERRGPHARERGRYRANFEVLGGFEAVFEEVGFDVGVVEG